MIGNPFIVIAAAFFAFAATASADNTGGNGAAPVRGGDEGTRKLHKAVYAAGCNMGIGHEPNGGVTTLEIPKSELPPGKKLTFAVRPLTSLGTAGKPITTEFKA